MNWTTGDLLDDYSQADVSKRLHLYLQYPHLRLAFMEMDRNKPGLAIPGGSVKCNQRLKSRDRMYLAYTWIRDKALRLALFFSPGKRRQPRAG
jgi:hypothetical protein